MPTAPPDERDAQLMAVALRLAARGLGRTWPNPAVGCVVVKDGRVVGRGWTQPGGRPHAETEALKRAGAKALGATAYVTLEPCAHYGHTPPCTMALIQAGVRKVVAATLCPDPRVDGQGIAQLRQAGVEVELGLMRAEAEALKRAGARALGATAYVTLEPCAHYGHTPPCTMALIHAGVRRVVAAALCPDKRVDGQGIAQLRQAGVEVELGLMRAEAEALNAGFFLKERASRPLVTLKLATSLDGRIATRTGQSQWLTGEAARARGHWLRATHDAIMIGSGTALADDPALTCRLPGLEQRSPVRIVLDGRLRLPATSRLAATAGEVPVWLFTRMGAGAGRRAAALRARRVEVLEVAAAPDHGLDLEEVLATLAARGITRLLVEGGAQLAAALLKARLVDRLAWFQAPLIIGGDGRAAVAPLDVEALAAASRFRREAGETLAQDTLQSYISSAEGEPCSPGSLPTSAGLKR